MTLKRGSEWALYLIEEIILTNRFCIFFYSIINKTPCWYTVHHSRLSHTKVECFYYMQWTPKVIMTWWHANISALLVICEWNPPVTAVNTISIFTYWGYILLDVLTRPPWIWPWIRSISNSLVTSSCHNCVVIITSSAIDHDVIIRA